MTELPQYPAYSGSDGGEDREPRPAGSSRTCLWWVVGVAVVGLMLVLHLAGVFGPGSH